MKNSINYIDLFAGGGGLSEGFIRAGFHPVAHIEKEISACYTIKTRLAYHFLKNQNSIEEYYKYISGNMSRNMFYNLIPSELLETVLNYEISVENLNEIFYKVDDLIADKRVDLIIGGPPCQAYSLVGRSCNAKRMRGDKRNYLYRLYTAFLKKYKPKYFVFENVTGLLSAKDETGDKYLIQMLKSFEDAGYTVEFEIINAADFGVLQNRKRVILVGKRGKQTDFFPEPEKWNPEVTVSEIFEDLPKLKSGNGNLHQSECCTYNGKYLFEANIKSNGSPVTYHIARPHNRNDLEIYKIAIRKWNQDSERLSYDTLPQHLKTHSNVSSFLDRFKVVAADKPYSHTIVAHIAKDGHYYIHPDINQLRSITPREAARIQSFPDDYFFESSSGKPARTTAYQQIGNAVPVLLAEKLAKELMKRWE